MNENTCVCCGEVIPEGIQVCSICMAYCDAVNSCDVINNNYIKVKLKGENNYEKTRNS